jgi:hypothetical protein
MQTYKRAALAIAFLTLIFSGGMSAGVIGARAAGSSGYQEERILEIFENDDYDTWRRIVAKRNKLGEIVTREDFSTFIEARKAARDGEYEKAISIAEALESELKAKFFSEA